MLKMELYARKHGNTDIVDIDELVSDEEVFKETAGCDFVEEDFLCCGAKECQEERGYERK